MGNVRQDGGNVKVSGAANGTEVQRGARTLVQSTAQRGYTARLRRLGGAASLATGVTTRAPRQKSTGRSWSSAGDVRAISASESRRSRAKSARPCVGIVLRADGFEAFGMSATLLATADSGTDHAADQPAIGGDAIDEDDGERNAIGKGSSTCTYTPSRPNRTREGLQRRAPREPMVRSRSEDPTARCKFLFACRHVELRRHR